MPIDYRRVAEEFATFLIQDTSKGTRKRLGDKVNGRCPRSSHEDKHPSFGYDVSKDAWACSCGSGKASELREEIGWISSEENLAQQAKKLIATRTVKPPPQDQPPDDIYEYENNNRKLKWRQADGTKYCKWEHKVNDHWEKDKLGDCGLYQEQILKLDLPFIFLSESESDANALMSIGFPCVATPNGASQPIGRPTAKLFNEKVVLVAEHQDPPHNPAGQKYAEKTLDALIVEGIEAYVFKPKTPHKDIRDWILAGATKEDIQAILDNLIPKKSEPVSAAQIEQMDLGEPDWTIWPIGAMETLTLVQGNPKGGKSTFCLYCALSIAKGVWLADRFEIEKPRRVLYLAYEDNLRRIKARLISYNRPMQLGPLPENLLLYERPPSLKLNDPRGANELKRIIQKYKIEVLMIDTFSYIHAATENDASEMQPVMAALRDLVLTNKVNIWLIHHVRKSGQNGDSADMTTRGRGSTVIAAAPDHILNWGNRVQPHLTYCQFVSKDADEDEFNVHYKKNVEEGTVQWEILDVSEREDILKRDGEVLTALETLWMTNPNELTFSTIQAALPTIAGQTLRDTLKSMAGKKKITMKKADHLPRKPWVYLKNVPTE